MTTVWKYQFGLGLALLIMPWDAQPIDVQEQDGIVTMWAIVNDTSTKVQRQFLTIGTGQVTAAPLSRDNYVGSIHGVDGWMVFHVFETTSAWRQ